MKVLMVVAAVFVWLGTAEATVWYVHPDSTLNTIQGGLDSCLTDDIVLVGPGVYLENIVWPNVQGIDLISEYGPDTTIIDGGNPSNPDSGSVILLGITLDNRTTIRGFTITNGTGTIITNTSYGGGILCYVNASPSVIGNIITANNATWGGGGIACSYSSAVIDSNIIRGNSADTAGGGILAYPNANPLITHNTITSNNSPWGAGLYIVSSSPTIIYNDITNNISSLYGGGLGITWSSAPILQYNNVIGNKAGSGGGGIYTGTSSTPTIKDCIIEDDTSGISPNGGGVRITGSAIPHFTHTTIANNWGSGICCYNATLVIDSCIIYNNSNNGIYCYSNGNAIVHRCEITDNASYAIRNVDPTITINAEYNWWGDSTGPYHPDSNPGGQGDTVSNYVDFIPWIGQTWIAESPITQELTMPSYLGPTIFRGSLSLPKGKTCRVFDITGRTVIPETMKPGVYFVEVEGKIVRKVLKVR